MFMCAAERIPLEENMICAVMVGHPVRIVDEAERHFEMKAVVPAVREGESLRKPRVDCPLVKFLHSAHSSGRKKTKIRPDAVRKLTMLTKIYAERWSERTLSLRTIRFLLKKSVLISFSVVNAYGR